MPAGTNLVGNEIDFCAGRPTVLEHRGNGECLAMDFPSVSSVRLQTSIASSKSYSLVVEPGQNNVDHGDRSDNTAKVTLTTPTRDLSVEISREQAVDIVEFNSQRKAAAAYLSPASPGSVPLKLAALKSADIDKADIAPVAKEVAKRKQIQAYYQGLSGIADKGSTGPELYSPTSSNGVAAYNNAVDVYIKQSLFFAKVENAQSFSAIA